MKIKILLLFSLLALGVFPVLAQDSATNTVSFNGISVSFPSSLATNVNVIQYPGEDISLEQPGGPTVPHTEFTFYNGIPPTDSFFYGEGSLSVFSTAAIAGYEQANAELTRLQSLLASRPDLSQYTVTSDGTNAANLPFLPVFPASQVLRAQAQYLDTPALQGVRYITVYRQDVSPFVATDFRYTFQGLTNDGSTYVAASFSLNTALFPAEIPADFDYDAFSAAYDTYMSESLATLINATSDDFTPALATLDGIVQTITVASTAPVTPVEPAPGATTEPTEVPSDATLGGLGGVTWVLASYGDPANPTPVVEGTQATLIFSSDGAGGNGSCNTFGGSFQFDNNTITFGNLISTMMACEEPIMAQEHAFLTALSTASAYQVNGSQLTITYDGGVLNFTAASA